MKKRYYSLLLVSLFLSLIMVTNSIELISVNSIPTNLEIQENTFAENSSILPPESITIISVGPENNPPSFTPLWEGYSIHSLAYDTLVELDYETGEVKPCLARQWTVSANSKQYTFFLRDDILCRDRSILTADDVKVIFDRIILGHAMPDYTSMPLESVQILDKFTIRINFNKPYATFLKNEAPRIHISESSTFTRSIPYKFGPTGDFYYIPIGSGPYIFQNVSDEGDYYNYNFIRNEHYFRGLPPFKTLQYHYYFNDNYTKVKEAVLDLKADIAPYLTSQMNTQDVNTSYWLPIFQGRGNTFALLNQNRYSVFQSQKVRLALNYAINKTEYYHNFTSKDIFGAFLPYNFISNRFESNNYSSASFPYNPDLANSLLDEAGYPREGDGYRFSIDVNGVPWGDDRILYLVSYLDAIGIKCNYNLTKPDDERIGNLFSGEFDIYYVSWATNPDWLYEAYLFLNSGGYMNNHGIYDKELEYYTSLGIGTPIQQEKVPIIELIKNRSLEYIPFLLLGETNYGYLCTPEVAPFIYMTETTPWGGFQFNCSSSNNDYLSNKIEDVQISGQSIYFPFADSLISTEGDFNVTMEVSNNLSTFLPGNHKLGKFYKILVSNQKVEYSLRCYYNLDELGGLNPDQLYLTQWGEKGQKWYRTNLINRNTTIGYVEIVIKGDLILQLGEEIGEILFQITYQYLPGLLLLITTVVTIASLSILYNQRFAKNFKEKYELL